MGDHGNESLSCHYSLQALEISLVIRYFLLQGNSKKTAQEYFCQEIVITSRNML